MKAEKLFQSWRCEVCGNEVELTKLGGGELFCCDKPMQLLTKELTPVLLGKAFAGESMARNRYDFFAKIAKKEGFEQIANFFSETALNEKEHAKREWKALNQLEQGKPFLDSSANLALAAAGEHYEHSEMYPSFAKVAREEGHEEVAKMFENIGQAEVAHEDRYLKLKARVDAETVFKDKAETVWKCGNCGLHLAGAEPPEECPACKHKQAYFERFCENF